MDLEYYEPQTLAEAMSLLDCYGTEALAIAGGTDVIPSMRSGELVPSHLVGIHKLRELTGLRETPEGGLWVGASTTFTTLLRSLDIHRRYPLLAEMARSMGTPQVRNVATLGGNLCNASPCADSAPVLLCLDAVAWTEGPNGSRKVPLVSFFTGPGSTILVRGEILVGVELPPPAVGTAGSYMKVGRNLGVDLAVVSLAIAGCQSEKNPSRHCLHIALGAVAPTPIRANVAESILAEEVDENAIRAAISATVEAISPISDLRGTAEYRTLVVANIAGRAIRHVLSLIP